MLVLVLVRNRYYIVSHHLSGMWKKMTRIVGNRSLVFCRNALVQIYMLPFYLEWLEYLCKEVGTYNWLHIRSLAKLRSQEVYDGLKARALMMVHIFQPLLVLAKSKKAAKRFLDQGPYIRHGLDIAKRMEEDPSFLLNRDFEFFGPTDFGPAVHDEHKRWLQNNKQEIDVLFSVLSPSEEDDEDIAVADAITDNNNTDMLNKLLRAYGSALVTRFNTGIFKEFMNEGKYFNPSSEMRSMLEHTNLTSDCIESFFGIFDNIITTNSCNLSFLAASGLATWTANRTGDWIRTCLTSNQQTILTKQAMRKGEAMQKQSKETIAVAADARAKKKADQAKKRKEKLRCKVVKALALRGPAVTLGEHLTVSDWDAEVARIKSDQPLSRWTKVVVKQIKTNVGILITFYGHKRADLMAYSAGGIKFSDEVLMRQYRLLVKRLESGALVLGKCQDVVGTLMADAHIFRGGKMNAVARKARAKRMEEVKEMIKSCEADAAMIKSKRLNQTSYVDPNANPNDPDNMIGRRVMVPGANWNQSDRWYSGIVVNYNRRRKRYGIKYNDGVTEPMTSQQLIPFLVSGALTAASLDDHRVIVRDDEVFQLRVHDRVYADYRSLGGYFYSTVISVTIVDGVRRYGLRYDDGDTENGVCRDNCVFICRPDNVTEAMIESAEKATEQNKLVTIDLTISDDTKDVEFLELEGHAGL